MGDRARKKKYVTVKVGKDARIVEENFENGGRNAANLVSTLSLLGRGKSGSVLPVEKIRGSY